MRVSGKTERDAMPVQPEPKCSHVKHTLVIDGEEYVCEKCTDPGCPVHGLESVMLATIPYIAESSREEEPLPMKGRESR